MLLCSRSTSHSSTAAEQAKASKQPKRRSAEAAEVRSRSRSTSHSSTAASESAGGGPAFHNRAPLRAKKQRHPSLDAEPVGRQLPLASRLLPADNARVRYHGTHCSAQEKAAYGSDAVAVANEHLRAR